MAVVWIVICVVLLAIEMHHFAFFAMFGAIGAAAAAGVAIVAPSLIPLQIAVAVIVAGVGLAVVRPFVSRAFHHRGPGVAIRGVHGGLVAARGVTLDEVSARPAGHVRLLGENWLAVAAFGDTIPPETPVIVTSVVGTTLSVRVADRDLELS